MNKIKSIAVSAALAVSVAAGALAGCGMNGKETAIVVNDKEINLGTANFLLRYQQAQSYSMMQMYGLTPGQALWDTEIDGSSDSSSSASTSSASGSATPAESTSAESASSTSAESESSTSEDTANYKTYGDQFKNSTVLNDIKKWCALEEHLGDYSVSLSEDQIAQIDETAKKTYDKNKSILKDMGTSEDDIKEALKLMSYEYLMRPKLNAEVDTNVSDEEAAQSTFTYARFSQTQTDSSTHMTTIVDDETKAKYQDEANQILRQIQSSGDIANADIGTIANGVDQNCESSQGSFGSDDTTYPDEVKNALSTLTDGEVYGSVIEAGGYYWVVRLDKQFDPDATDSQKKSIVNKRQSDHYNEVLDQWTSAQKVTTTKAWDKLKVTDDDEYSVIQDTTDTTQTTESTGSGAVSGSSAAR